MDISNDLPLFYSDLAQTVQSRIGDFPGFLDPVDITIFDAAVAGTHTLRYPDTKTLAVGDLLTVKRETYKVFSPPRRINADEYVADLVLLKS